MDEKLAVVVDHDRGLTRDYLIVIRVTGQRRTAGCVIVF
ncbi:hypothetical protein CA13_13830 [Planctomycetes bacterium CA13]|uniref:Uncharacterized protein n=1 Tax=Novipirellula herctigrandis TaxID=2527986 RepID=A0A5C5YZH8_9BACT|nr:hypothetical protein CA13_13830 [Planctomycetes bacterium CA13]